MESPFSRTPSRRVQAREARSRPEEWRGLKDLRLRALETDPDAFGSTLIAVGPCIGCPALESRPGTGRTGTPLRITRPLV